MKYLLLYISIANIIGFFIMAIDKYKSKHNKWRVKEITLFAIAFIGGAVGVKAGMDVFHHKTKHNSFTIGIPVLIVVNIALYALCFYYIAF